MHVGVYVQSIHEIITALHCFHDVSLTVTLDHSWLPRYQIILVFPYTFYILLTVIFLFAMQPVNASRFLFIRNM